MEIVILIVMLILSFILGYIIGDKNSAKHKLSEEEKEFMSAMSRFLNYDGSLNYGNKEK